MMMEQIDLSEMKFIKKKLPELGYDEGKEFFHYEGLTPPIYMSLELTLAVHLTHHNPVFYSVAVHCKELEEALKQFQDMAIILFSIYHTDNGIYYECDYMDVLVVNYKGIHNVELIREWFKQSRLD